MVEFIGKWFESTMPQVLVRCAVDQLLPRGCILRQTPSSAASGCSKSLVLAILGDEVPKNIIQICVGGQLLIFHVDTSPRSQRSPAAN